MGFEPVTGLSGSAVELQGDGVEVVLGVLGQVGALGEVLAQEPVGVLVVPRCHGECGSQKNTGMPVATVNRACSVISRPWSQASDRFSSEGSRPIATCRSAATRIAVWSCGTRCKIVYLEARSTKVMIAEALPAPMIRSPPQWPGTARSSASGGRSVSITMSLITCRLPVTLS